MKPDIIFRKLILLLAMLSASLPLSAIKFEVDGIYYSTIGSNAEVISGDKKYKDEVAIPEEVTYNGITYPVTSIGYAAFNGCSALTAITIPNSVTYIYDETFKGCSSLTSITISNSVTSIGNSAFLGCSALTAITIPNSVTSIGNAAFRGCSALTAITIPNSVTSIGNAAFRGCSGLHTLIFEDGEQKLFCGESVFDDSPLETGHLGRNIFNSNSKSTLSPFAYRSNLKNITIGNSVTSIYNHAFQDCSSLTSITIGNSVTSIGEEAFQGCSSLTSITISNSVTYIGFYAFQGCSGLTSITIPNSVTRINQSAFSGCSGLTSITISNSVTSIGYYAFSGCSSLTAITIPNSVTSISDYAFRGCSGLLSLIFEDGEQDLYCGESVFDDSPLETGHLGRNIFTNSYTPRTLSPFANKSNLKNITIGNSVTSIGYEAFQGCSSLTAIEIPGSVTSIGYSAFSGCSSLTAIEIPGSVTSIGYSAFSGCSSLTSISIPNSVTSIDEYTFYGCSGLTSITIPNSVISIGYYAFYGCSRLKSIEIPGSVSSISSTTFSGCSVLTSMVFEDGEDELRAPYTMFGKSAYSYIYLGRTLADAKNNSYFNKKAISTFEFGENITSIQDNLFNGCAVNDLILSSGMQAIKPEELPAGLESICLKSAAFNPVPDSYLIELRGINPETTLDIAANPDFNKFNHLSYKDDNKYYTTVIWNIPVDATGAYYSNDKGALIPDNQPCILKTGYSEGGIFHNGEDVTDKITSDEGYTIFPTYAHLKNRIDAFDNTTVRKVALPAAGSLFNTLGLDQIQAAEGLVITGNINGTDVMTLNRMPKLKYLDLSGANIVAGGMTYRDNLKTTYNTIGSYFFYSLPNLIVLKLPESITKIEDNAFEGCSALATLTIPGNCVSMGESLFTGCYRLFKITFEPGEKNLVASGEVCAANTHEVYLSRNISNGRFTDSLSKLIIGEGTEKIEYSLVEPCKNLLELIIENGPLLSLTGMSTHNFPSCPLRDIYIGREIDMLFIDCAEIENVRINDGGIPDNCFSERKPLKSVEISGKSVIGSKAFQNCPALNNVIITGNNTIGAYAFSGCTKIANLTVTGENTLSEYAFSKCTGLNSVVIEGNNTLGVETFDNCYNLKELSISGNGTIGESCFSDCHELNDINLCGIGEYSFGKNAFTPYRYYITGKRRVTIDDLAAWCKLNFTNGASNPLAYNADLILNGETVTELVIPESIDKVKPYSFFGSSIKSLIVNDNVTSIGEFAFSESRLLQSAKLSNNISDISTGAFKACSALTSINIPDALPTINDETFSGCSSLPEIRIPETVNSIRNSAFYGCPELSEINIPDNVTSIGDNAFYDCSGASSVTFGNKIETIGKSAFERCSTVTEIKLPDSVTSLGNNVFKSCSALLKVSLSNTITKIPDGAFWDCSSLPAIIIPNSVITIGKNAFNGCTSLGSIEIPDKVTAIGDYSFRYCTSLKGIAFGKALKTIGVGSFEDCTSLQSVNIPNNVTYLGTEAFIRCQALTDAVLSDGMEEIYGSTFAGCSALESVQIGKNTKKIADNAFNDCAAINKIRSLNPVPPVITSEVFSSVDKNVCQLVVTKGNLVNYWLDPVWKEFLNMNDNLLALNPLPAMRYGDAPMDLSAYAPEGVTLNYESSDNSVARLEGTMLSVVGAGEATIGASYPEDGTPMEIIGQMRQLIIDKADLDVALEKETYEIVQGEDLPAFGLTLSGLCYEDSASDIDELPSIVCEAENTDVPGEYAINLEGGADRNYNVHTKAAKLIIHEASGVENVSCDTDVKCYGHNGRLTVEGTPAGAIVNIYRFDGSLCHTAKSDGLTMTFEVAHDGFYIVTVNGKPYRLKI